VSKKKLKKKLDFENKKKKKSVNLKEKNSQILEKNSPNFRNHKKILKKASADNIFSNEEY
jgi:hypothetical protein